MHDTLSSWDGICKHRTKANHQLVDMFIRHDHSIKVIVSGKDAHLVRQGGPGKRWPLCHHLPTAHQDPEKHEVLKVPAYDQVIYLHYSAQRS